MIKTFEKFILEKEYWEIPDKTIDEVKEILMSRPIMFYDFEEQEEIFNGLVDLGFKVFPLVKEKFRYNCFHYLKNNVFDYDFCQSLQKPDHNSIEIEEFNELMTPVREEIEKRREEQRKLHSKEDPFNEEDWDQ